MVTSKKYSKHEHVSLQVVFLWLLRGRQRLTSAVWTTRTAPAPCPTCLCCLETTASWSSTTTSTFQEAPFLPRLLVTVHEARLSQHRQSICSSMTSPCFVSGDDSMRMSQLKVGSTADIPLDIGELDLTQLTASLTSPSGREEPCLLKMLRNGHVGRCRSAPEQSRGLSILTPPFICHRHLLCPEGDWRALGKHQEERPPYRQQPHFRYD